MFVAAIVLIFIIISADLMCRFVRFQANKILKVGRLKPSLTKHSLAHSSAHSSAHLSPDANALAMRDSVDSEIIR